MNQILAEKRERDAAEANIEIAQKNTEKKEIITIVRESSTLR